MRKQWKPSVSQRREFAQRMQDPEEKAAYELRKRLREEKRRASSQFDYGTAGGFYIPTKAQNDFCFEHMEMFTTDDEIAAANDVLYGFSSQEKVHHDSIHIVNEMRRNFYNTH